MQLFLTSTTDMVAKDLHKHVTKAPQDSKLVFIDTAAEVSEGPKDWLMEDRQSLVDAGFTVTDYTLTGKTLTQLETDLSEFDVFFMSGGNTFYLLEKIRESGFDIFIEKQLSQGKPYIGCSAGSIVMGPNIGMTKKLDNHLQAPNLKSYDGLNKVNFVVLPHWGSKSFRNLYLHARLDLAYDEPYAYILLRDGQYVLVNDDHYQIITVV